jgi:putative sterol carrier protein
MGNWLSKQWIADTLELGAKMPEKQGAKGTVQYFLVGGTSEYSYWWKIENGQLTGAGLGVNQEAEIEITVTVDDARAMQTGQLDPTAAFVEGKLKVTGDFDLLMSLLPITSSPEYKQLELELASRTDFYQLG